MVSVAWLNSGMVAQAAGVAGCSNLLADAVAVVLCAVLCATYVVLLRYWRNDWGRRMPAVWQVTLVAGTLSLLCWGDAAGGLAPEGSASVPPSRACVLAALVMSTGTIVGTTRGRCFPWSWRATVAWLVLFLVPCCAVGSAAGALAVAWPGVLQHIVSLGFVWACMTLCLLAVLRAAEARMDALLARPGHHEGTEGAPAPGKAGSASDGLETPLHPGTQDEGR
jgi:hypothetical protein